MTGSARNYVLVPFEFGHRRLNDDVAVARHIQGAYSDDSN